MKKNWVVCGDEYTAGDVYYYETEHTAKEKADQLTQTYPGRGTWYVSKINYSVKREEVITYKCIWTEINKVS